MLAIQAFTQADKGSAEETSITRLLTQKERITIGRRILIAQAILAGKTRYEINNHIQISPNTFTQIKRWLESEFPDYISAHKRTLSETKVQKVRIEPFSYEHLKKKYPAHFLLFSLVEELFSI